MIFATLREPSNVTFEPTESVFRKIVAPLTSNANAEEMSLLIATDEEPEPTSKLPSMETSKVKRLRFTTYKLPFKDKSLLT